MKFWTAYSHEKEQIEEKKELRKQKNINILKKLKGLKCLEIWANFQMNDEKIIIELWMDGWQAQAQARISQSRILQVTSLTALP